MNDKSNRLNGNSNTWFWWIMMTRTTIIIMIYMDSDETGQLSSHGFADDELAAL